MTALPQILPLAGQADALRRIVRFYFTDPDRQLTVEKGEKVLQQKGYNDRLYYLKSGKMSGYYQESEGVQPVVVFQVESGMFFGVHSFFARTFTASTTVIAQCDCELAWIDINTPAVDVEIYGSLSTQFMPVMVDELYKRQQQASVEAVAKEKAQQKLSRSEQMTTLGQLAAGISHELNNAVGVIASKTERMQDCMSEWLSEHQQEAIPFFDKGVKQGQSVSSVQARAKGRQLATLYRLDPDKARLLARAMSEDEDPDQWLSNLDYALKYWDLGRDLHDLKLAAKHAVSIVRSVKQLGGADHQRVEQVNINDTINKSLSLLQSNLRGIRVTLRPADLPTITGSSTEFVQIWVNIIKNATEALTGYMPCSREIASPSLEIATRISRNKIVVTIANNGPVIDEPTRRKIFQPDFTTKKGGLSFGLGLGLSIVQRLVNEYNGSIAVRSDPDLTTFRIRLPVEG